VFAGTRTAETRARSHWVYRGRPARSPSRDREARRVAGLDSALRAGHGAGATFTVEVLGGPEATIVLSTGELRGELWVERVLLRGYEPGDWIRSGGSIAPAHARRWIGRRRGLPGEQSGVGGPACALLPSLVAALRGAPRTVRLTLSFRPLRLPDWTAPSIWPQTVPEVPRPASTSRARPAAVTGAPPPPRPLTWAVAVALTAQGPVTEASAATALASVRTAWTALDGRPLAIREASPDGAPVFASLLAASELAALLPGAELEPIAEAGSPEPSRGLPLGRTPHGDPVFLEVSPSDGRHFALLGETGMGKSSLLATLAVRAAGLGGLVLLDPMGETASRVREELLASGSDVLWLAPGVPGARANALAGLRAALASEPVRAQRELEDLVHALRRVRAGRYVDATYWGPRLEEMTLRAVRAAAWTSGGTLEDAHALLASAGATRVVLPPPADAEVRELTARVRERPEDAEGARRLLYEIVRNPTLVEMLCARAPALTFPDLVRERRVVLISGEASRVGEATARFLLSAYLALIWSSLLARPAPAKTFVLLDEAQWFGHEGLAEMLRLARRCNVHVGLATQSLASLPTNVQDAVRTNVADLVVFRGSPEEARGVARAVGGVSEESLLRLAQGEAIVFQGKGNSIRWVRTARLPPCPGPARRRGERPLAPGPAAAALPEDLRGETTSILAPRSEPTWRSRGDATAPGHPQGLVAVSLDQLRAERALSEADLRALGGELGRAGAIRRTQRSSDGTVWWVEPNALRRALAHRGPGTPAGTADVGKLL